MRYLIFVLFIIFNSSCKKQTAIEVDNNFEGEWFFQATESHHHISINSNGKGYNYGSASWHLMTGDQKRKWFVKDGILEFGHASPEEEKFHIDSFPKISLINDTIGENHLNIGDKFMWLDGRIYISSK